MTAFASAGFNYILTVFAAHPCTKTGCSFLFALGAAESTLCHELLLQKNDGTLGKIVTIYNIITIFVPQVRPIVASS